MYMYKYLFLEFLIRPSLSCTSFSGLLQLILQYSLSANINNLIFNLRHEQFSHHDKRDIRSVLYTFGLSEEKT